MINHKIEFSKTSWETISSGAKQKLICLDNKKIRLLQLNDNFVEKDWCTKGHIGYVLDGVFTIDFDGTKTLFMKGDGLFIKDGIKSKHKAIISQGDFVELLLIED